MDRWLVITEDGDVSTYASEGVAREAAEDFAKHSPGITFYVYQLVGSASVEPKVIWKGAASCGA